MRSRSCLACPSTMPFVLASPSVATVGDPALTLLAEAGEGGPVLPPVPLPCVLADSPAETIVLAVRRVRPRAAQDHYPQHGRLQHEGGARARSGAPARRHAAGGLGGGEGSGDSGGLGGGCQRRAVARVAAARGWTDGGGGLAVAVAGDG